MGSTFLSTAISDISNSFENISLNHFESVLPIFFTSFINPEKILNLHIFKVIFLRWGDMGMGGGEGLNRKLKNKHATRDIMIV